ncbi:MAG: glycosyltransferase family 4 protein [Anaerolineae bacterium]|nr:glycosyltransferase family 4 protein [Anaerolineae bacterium]
MAIALVTKPDQHMTGLLRYALSIYEPLRARRVEIDLVHPRSPAPEAVARVGRAVGLDTTAFFHSYPVAVRLGGASLCHLASQTLATLLLFQRLPPTVVTVHDIIPYLVRDDPRFCTYRHLGDCFFDRLALAGLRRAKRLIAISEYTKRCIISVLDYPAERIHVVYRAVDTEAFRPSPVPAAFRQRYGLEADCQYVLYVGSEDPRKNVDGLVQALALLRQQLPAVQLLKVGAAHFAAERARLLELVTDLGLEGEVRFFDHVPDEELALWYNAADVFVLPSFYEGFGLPALEAMACGTPVIAANRASLPEVVGPGGVLVDPDDVEVLAERMTELLADPEQRAAASRAALRQAARFSIERQARETMAVYQEVATR